MRNLIVSAILVVLIVLFLSLQSFWAGLVYFALSFLFLLCAYWVVVLIMQYIEDYFKHFDEDFKLYCIKLINSTNYTTQEVNDNIEFHKTNYRKSLRRDKAIDIIKILFILTVGIVGIVSMFNM